MFQIIINKEDYSKPFLVKLKNLFTNTLLQEVRSDSYNRLRDVVKKKFNASLNEILTEIGNSWEVLEGKDRYTVYLNVNKKIKAMKISSIISLIDYGGIEVKGTNLINSTFNEIKNNMFLLFSFNVLVNK